MADADWQKWFEGIWADREERLYKQFFGDIGPGIYPIPASTFESLGDKEPDPRFLTHGVFECPPTAERPEWIYVSSGMSNAWGESPETVQPEQYSGLGMEFTLHTTQRGAWPIKLLHWVMAVQLLMAAGKLQGELLQQHDRIPLGGALAKKEGLLTHVLVSSPVAAGHSGVAKALSYPAEFSLASGRVEFLLLIGITEREREFAKTQGPEGLITLLRHRGVFPRTEPERASLV